MDILIFVAQLSVDIKKSPFRTFEFEHLTLYTKVVLGAFVFGP